MIVFDASTFVSAALKADSVPERALLRAGEFDVLARPAPDDTEIAEVLSRPKFANVISLVRRRQFLEALRGMAIWFEPSVRVTDCRDPKDDDFLEPALAAGAEIIVSSDSDLRVPHPWRGIRILAPGDYLAFSHNALPG